MTIETGFPARAQPMAIADLIHPYCRAVDRLDVPLGHMVGGTTLRPLTARDALVVAARPVGRRDLDPLPDIMPEPSGARCVLPTQVSIPHGR